MKKHIALMLILIAQLSWSETPPSPPPQEGTFDEATGLWVSTRPKKNRRKRNIGNPVRFGLIGGLNISNVSTEPNLETGSRVLPLAGMALEIPVAPYFLLQSELEFAQYGFTISGSTPGFGNYEAKTTGSVIQAGWFGKIRFSETPSSVKPFFLLGAGVSRELSTKVSVNDADSTDFSDQTEDWDFAAILGLGIQFEVSEDVDLGLETRYLLGLKDGDRDASSNVKTRTVLIAASLFF